MPATSTPARTSDMAKDADDTGTKTVRIAGAAATKLKSIAALKEQMGERFKPIEYLNGLVEGPIDALYEETLDRFARAREASKKGGGAKKPPKGDG